MYSILRKRQALANEQAKRNQTASLGKHSLAKGAQTSTWEDIQASLKQDLSFLKTLAGHQEKAPFKQELVNKYRDVVTHLLAEHDNLAGLDLVWWFYQWQVDLGLLLEVHDDFRAAIDRGLETPVKYKSDAQTAYCDIVFQYSHKADKNDELFDQDFLIDAVQDIQEGKLATNAPLKVKMFRLVGDWYFASEEKQKALTLFEQVMALDPKKGGRKTKLTQLKEELAHG